MYTNPRMPTLAKLGLVDISAFNGVEWVLKNDAPAHKLNAYYDKPELTELKDAACLPPSTPTAFIRAPKPVGLGHRERDWSVHEPEAGEVLEQCKETGEGHVP